jgi:hypothetical protein
MDDRREEQIHAEIDDLISDFDRSELRKALDGDEEAREFHADMTRLTGELGRVEEVEVPAGLRQSILDEVAGGHRLVQFRPKERPRTVAVLQYSAVLAAGLVLGLVVAPLVSRPDGSLNPSELGGSMVPGAPSDGTRVELVAEGIRGEIRLDRSENRAVVTLDLEAGGPVEVILGYDGSSTGLVGLTRNAGRFDKLEASGDRVTLAGTGALIVSVEFDRWGPGGADLHLVVLHSGETVHDGRLSLSDGPTSF